MSRIRTIKPEITLDEELAGLGFAARWFFVNLWTHCDKAGRCEDRPKMLKAIILPWDKIKAEVLLDELSPKFIIRYEVAGKRYLQIRTWHKHQRPLPNEKESEIPVPSEKCITNVNHMVDKCYTLDAMEGKGKELEGKGKEVAPSPTVSEPPILTYPTVGKIRQWHLTLTFINILKADFPGLNVLDHCRSARAWCEASPKKRKTSGGMPAFLVRWLTKEQNINTRDTQAPKKYTLSELMADKGGS